MARSSRAPVADAARMPCKTAALTSWVAHVPPARHARRPELQCGRRRVKNRLHSDWVHRHMYKVRRCRCRQLAGWWLAHLRQPWLELHAHCLRAPARLPPWGATAPPHAAAPRDHPWRAAAHLMRGSGAVWAGHDCRDCPAGGAGGLLFAVLGQRQRRELRRHLRHGALRLRWEAGRGGFGWAPCLGSHQVPD